VTPQAGDRCTGCGYCAEHCPVGAIDMTTRRARMDPNRCIRCYCCHELCPQLAVELKTPWLGRVLMRK
ncbi:MAG: 4Fe-4S binding protein, partial [Chloroflexi bacterium]|nr:4Fe-4S binding protein [Chloroflexota bacterium]